MSGRRLTTLPGTFAVCRLPPDAAIPPRLLRATPVSITRTPDELSIVCAEELAPAGVPCEKGWKCLALEGPIPFATTGVLASLAAPLSRANVSIFAISTFDTDYILVPEALLAEAVAALRAGGHEVD